MLPILGLLLRMCDTTHILSLVPFPPLKINLVFVSIDRDV